MVCLWYIKSPGHPLSLSHPSFLSHPSLPTSLQHDTSVPHAAFPALAHLCPHCFLWSCIQARLRLYLGWERHISDKDLHKQLKYSTMICKDVMLYFQSTGGKSENRCEVFPCLRWFAYSWLGASQHLCLHWTIFPALWRFFLSCADGWLSFNITLWHKARRNEGVAVCPLLLKWSKWDWEQI